MLLTAAPTEATHAGSLCMHLLTRNTLAQVILALPDRPETQPFWQLVGEAGLRQRALRHVARPDLATPITIYRLSTASSWQT